MKRVKSSKRAFTLIELLVVVLIIGILAAIAVPQYQKAVEKSRAVEGMTLVKSAYEAFEHYYLAHGEYPTSFDQLDIDIPGTKITTSLQKEHRQDVYKVDEDWAIRLWGNKSDGATGVSSYRLSGPYAGGGFGMHHYYYHAGVPRREFVCQEYRYIMSSNLPTYGGERGSYCTKLFQGTLVDKDDSINTFVLP